MGHLPNAAYIGAVALGALVFSFLYWGFGFLRMGTTGFIAQAHGINDFEEVRYTLVRALILSLVLGLLILLLQKPAFILAFRLLESSSEVESLTQTYVNIRVWSAPAVLAFYAMLGCMIGLHNTRYVLYLQLVLNITNIVLDLAFVNLLGMTVNGVALATLIAEYLAFVVGLLLLRKRIPSIFTKPDWQRVFNFARISELVTVNANIAIRTLCLVFSFSYFTAQSGKLGVIPLAANAVLMIFQSFIAYGLDGFAHAVEALAGSACGAKDRAAFSRAVKLTTFWALGTSIVVCGIFLLFGTSLIALLTDLKEVRSYAEIYLPWLIVSPVISFWSFQLDGIFISTTRAAEMRNAMLICTGLFIALVYVLLPWLGNHGLWLALTLFMVLRAVTLGVQYPRILRSFASG